MTTEDLHSTDVERRRQRALESLNILDSEPSERLDRVTRMGRTFFGVPICTITVLDVDRAWFPSASGIERASFARPDTFCDRTVAAAEVTMTSDASQDPRFRDLPVVRDDPSIRFYAGHPLVDPHGNIVGTFCLFDTEKRTLDDQQLEVFADLAAWAQSELLATAEMGEAQDAQLSLLPSTPLRMPGWTVDGLCLPALAVGGDYFDYGATDDVLHLGVGDVMGKGTGAALLGAGVRASLRATHEAVVRGADLGAVIGRVERGVSADLERAASYVTLFQAVVDLGTGALRYVDAGMGLAVVVRSDGSVTQLHGDDLPLGLAGDAGYTQHHTTLEPGDRLMVFSDGVLDLLDDPDAWVEPVADLLRRNDRGADVLREVARLAIDRTPLDDVTVVTVYRLDAAE